MRYLCPVQKLVYETRDRHGVMFEQRVVPGSKAQLGARLTLREATFFPDLKFPWARWRPHPDDIY